MTSGGGTFSPEEIKYLKSLSAVAEATAKRITYTDDFKRYCVVHYNEGASPVRMFREAGLDPALIGYKGFRFGAFPLGSRGRTKHSGECASSESLARLGGIVTSGWYRQRIRFPRIARTSRHHLPRLPQRAEQ